MYQSPQNIDCEKLIATLKEVLRAKKITYAKLAKKLGVSEVTIKRLFSKHTCSLQTLFSICDSIEISFFDLAALAKQEPEHEYTLTNEQEVFFAANPAIFGIFRQLHRGEKPSTVAVQWKLSQAKLFRVLRKLEKLKLLEVLPENQIQMKVAGNIKFQHQGPLAKTILRAQTTQFLDHIENVLKNKDVCLHSAEVELSKLSLSELVAEIHALGSKYRARASREKSLLPADKLRSVRWLYAFAPYQTNWQQYELKE